MGHARRYVAAGLSVIPVRTDGSKAPKMSGWREYSDRLPTEAELVAWFGGPPAGIGVVPGPASGNLAVLDFESEVAWDDWLSRIEPRLMAHVDAAPIVRTPSGGRHVWLRLTEPAPGGVLARRADKEVLIEVRGLGNQVVAPGSPAACHETHIPYQFEAEGWLAGGDAVPVPMDDFAEMCVIARDLNQWAPTEHKPSPGVGGGGGGDPTGAPGWDFNLRGTWEETGLFESGWKWVRQDEAGKGYVCRPGKDAGVSASVGKVTSRGNGWPLLWCWSTSVPEFEADKGYSRFAVYAILKHKGDFKAAARALRDMKYGEAKPPRVTMTGVTPEGPRRKKFEDKDDDAPKDDGSRSAWVIIRDFYRVRYRPAYKTGDGIYSRAAERDIVRAEATTALPPALIEPLSLATDVPRFPNGGVKFDSLPTFFKRWAGTGWTALLDELPEEDDANLDALEDAAESFRQMVRSLLLSQVVLGDSHANDQSRIERRSLIDWAYRFAKVGPWRSIRSYKLWCKCVETGGGESILQVAISYELLAQVNADRRLIAMGKNRFGRRCGRYGVGHTDRNDRPGRQRGAIILDPAFVSELLSGAPCDDLAGDFETSTD